MLSPAGEIHRNGTGIFKTALRYAPLTLTTLAALVPDDLGAQITLQDEGVQPLDLDFPPSLVGITAITGTALRAYAIADQLRAKGLEVTDIVDHGWAKSIYFKDPNGLSLEYCCVVRDLTEDDARMQERGTISLARLDFANTTGAEVSGCNRLAAR